MTARQWLYVGTQRSSQGTGLSRLSFDPASGRLGDLQLADAVPDPSLFAIDPTERFLYTCNSGTPGGVTAYAVDRASGALQRLNHHVSEGRGPSQLSLDRTGRYVLAANYGGGYLEVISIAPDGSLGPQTVFVRHIGSSVHPERQTRAYVHCAMADPTNQFVLAADLGTDQVVLYRFDANTGALTPHSSPCAAVRPGSGPRHLVWHPNGQWVYLVEELSNEVTVFEWDAQWGTLTERQTVPTLPDDFHGESTAAEILVHPSGAFVYASNRGHDSIAVFSVAAADGTLSFIEHVGTQGSTPRYLAFDATGRWLVAANCDSDALVIFEIDPKTGGLRSLGSPVMVPRPYGLAFVRAHA